MASGRTGVKNPVASSIFIKKTTILGRNQILCIQDYLTNLQLFLDRTNLI
ncbi:MAG: hypothetical protein P2A85_26140 [Microcoleus anatoxicus]